MTLLPVIERELRAESRGAFTYWLRVAGGASLLAAGTLVYLEGRFVMDAGGQMFRLMHLVLFIAIWIVALVMTADSISRERREGTLGLLFLTPLRPLDVVLAKGLAHGLRAAGVWVAAVPVLVVPFLMGGVGWREALAAVLIDFSALCWALAIGLLASSLCRTLTRALALAAILGVAGLVTLTCLHGAGLMNAIYGVAVRPGRHDPAFEQLMSYGAVAILQMDRVTDFFNPATTFWPAWFGSLAVIALASLAMFVLIAALAAAVLRRAARETGPSAARLKVEKTFCTPAYALGFYRRWMRRVLERNPVGWLERRTWQARLVTWTWLAVMIVLLSWFLGQMRYGNSDFDDLMTFLGWSLVGNVALTAAGSLRRERESGVIELLLVSPLTVRQMIGGRLRGIAGQFLPAAVLLFGSWLWLLHAFRGIFVQPEDVAASLTYIWFFIITLLTVPVIGLYFSLRCRMFIAALFWTAVVGVALPWCAATCVSFFGSPWAMGYLLAALSLIFVLSVWHKTASPGLSVTLSAGLLALSVVAPVAVNFFPEGPGNFSHYVPVVLICTTLQIAIAALLGALLRRRLERRDFALPQ